MEDPHRGSPYVNPKCGAKGPKELIGWTLKRKPICNRQSPHGGSHKEYSMRTFVVLAEWDGEF
jgi:hypothetical protein